ncbi:hypothetical protein SBY92_005209 [Candida maltosa Xu316]
MSLSIQDIPSILSNNSKLNYLSDLLTITSTIPETLSEDDEKLLNTLELFTFGNYHHYVKYRTKYIELNGTILNKLLKLTLISINVDHLTNQTSFISFDSILNDYQIDDVRSLYPLIIELNFQKLINVKIDDANGQLIVLNGGDEKDTNDSGGFKRDVYNSDDYTLRVLDETIDIPNKSVSLARAKLIDFINEKLIPLKTDFENRSVANHESSTKVENTRKRKTPDNI